MKNQVFVLSHKLHVQTLDLHGCHPGACRSQFTSLLSWHWSWLYWHQLTNCKKLPVVQFILFWHMSNDGTVIWKLLEMTVVHVVPKVDNEKGRPQNQRENHKASYTVSKQQGLQYSSTFQLSPEQWWLYWVKALERSKTWPLKCFQNYPGSVKEVDCYMLHTNPSLVKQIVGGPVLSWSGDWGDVENDPLYYFCLIFFFFFLSHFFILHL